MILSKDQTHKQRKIDMGQRYVLLGRKEDRNVEVNERERN